MILSTPGVRNRGDHAGSTEEKRPHQVFQNAETTTPSLYHPPDFLLLSIGNQTFSDTTRYIMRDRALFLLLLILLLLLLLLLLFFLVDSTVPLPSPVLPAEAHHVIAALGALGRHVTPGAELDLKLQLLLLHLLAGEPLVVPCDLALEAHLAAAAGRADFREPAKVGELQRRSTLQVRRELEEPSHGPAPPLSPPRAPRKPGRRAGAAPLIRR